jgi:hypothetical protein
MTPRYFRVTSTSRQRNSLTADEHNRNLSLTLRLVPRIAGTSANLPQAGPESRISRRQAHHKKQQAVSSHRPLLTPNYLQAREAFVARTQLYCAKEEEEYSTACCQHVLLERRYLYLELQRPLDRDTRVSRSHLQGGDRQQRAVRSGSRVRQSLYGDVGAGLDRRWRGRYHVRERHALNRHRRSAARCPVRAHRHKWRGRHVGCFGRRGRTVRRHGTILPDFRNGRFDQWLWRDH